jgi:hypothetical protein
VDWVCQRFDDCQGLEFLVGFLWFDSVQHFLIFMMDMVGLRLQFHQMCKHEVGRWLVGRLVDVIDIGKRIGNAKQIE